MCSPFPVSKQNSDYKSRLFTELPENTNGCTIFGQNNGLHVFSVITNINTPKEVAESYFVVVIQNQYFITQTWYSLYFDGDVFFRHCEIQRDWRWSPFRKITP